MSNVRTLIRKKLPSDTVSCIEKLLQHAQAGALTGLAFVAYMDGSGYIADTCGEATEKPHHTLDMIDKLRSKLRKQIGLL